APDIIVTAKGLSSGYAPLGALIVSKRVVDTIAYGSGSFIHGFTYSSHPISLAAGKAVLNYVSRQKLIDAADSEKEGPAKLLAHHFRGRLDLQPVGDVRGIGLLWAIELAGDRDKKMPFEAPLNFSGRVARAAFSRGLLFYPVRGCAEGDSGDHVLIAPPPV